MKFKLSLNVPTSSLQICVVYVFSLGCDSLLCMVSLSTEDI